VCAYLHCPLLQQRPCRSHWKTWCDAEKRKRAWVVQGASPWYASGGGSGWWRWSSVMSMSADVERRRRAPRSSADDELGLISPADHIVRHLNWDGGFLGTNTKYENSCLKRKLPFLFLFLFWTGKIGKSAISGAAPSPDRADQAVTLAGRRTNVVVLRPGTGRIGACGATTPTPRHRQPAVRPARSYGPAPGGDGTQSASDVIAIINDGRRVLTSRVGGLTAFQLRMLLSTLERTGSDYIPGFDRM